MALTHSTKVRTNNRPHSVHGKILPFSGSIKNMMEQRNSITQPSPYQAASSNKARKPLVITRFDSKNAPRLWNHFAQR